MDLHKKIHDKYTSIEKRGSEAVRKLERPFRGDIQPWTLRRIFAWIITLTIASIAAGIFLFFASIAILAVGLPSVENIAGSSAQGTEIYDRTGTLLYTISGEENRKYIPYDQISPYVISATIAIEDDQFWEHKGFDLTGIAAAGLHEVLGIGKRRGGSTITQQYVKNAFLTPERSIIRKIRELIMAVRLEQKYDKKEILELYLNEIPYGNNAYGIERAAEIYFGKKASELNLGESVILASIPQAPSYYNPYGSHRHTTITKSFTPEEIKSRNIKSAEQITGKEYIYGLIGKPNFIDETRAIYMPGRVDQVLKRMVDLRLITNEEKSEAWRITQSIEFLPFRYSINAPHFVFYVRELLEQKYGKEIVERGGLKVTTTLDWKLQQVAENAIAKRAETYQKNYKASNAAALFADPKTGDILVMVGSRDYFNDDIDGKVNVTLRQRQPGSSFKPFVYAQAFLRRYTPATVLYDTPVKIGPDKPQNYDGTFHGPMPIRRALGQSRNIPAIKSYFLGGEQGPIIDLATQMGISTLDKNHDYGYPLAIGAGEVKMIDMVRAFGAFANEGKRPELNPILKVEDKNGKVIEEFSPQEYTRTWQDAIDPEVAYLINDILADPSIKLSQNLIVPGRTTATKTGTSTNKTKSKGVAYPMDLWTMGYTPSIVGSVWVGNNRGDPLSNSADGSNVAAPIWKEIMTEFLKDKPDESFPRPQGIRDITISSATGLLPSENTPEEDLRTEKFASFAMPTEIESAYTKYRVDKRNNLLANDYCPPELIQEKVSAVHRDPYENEAWKTGIGEWYKSKSDKGENVDTIPTEESPLCIKEKQDESPSVSIISPSAYQEVDSTSISIFIQFSATNGVKEVTYLFDNLPRAVKSTQPYDTATIKVPKFAKSGEIHSITVKVTDKNDYTGSSTIQVKLGSETATASSSPSSSQPSSSSPSKLPPLFTPILPP